MSDIVQQNREQRERFLQARVSPLGPEVPQPRVFMAIEDAMREQGYDRISLYVFRKGDTTVTLEWDRDQWRLLYTVV